jgi:hypothetical protein
VEPAVEPDVEPDVEPAVEPTAEEPVRGDAVLEVDAPPEGIQDPQSAKTKARTRRAKKPAARRPMIKGERRAGQGKRSRNASNKMNGQNHKLGFISR